MLVRAAICIIFEVFYAMKLKHEKLQNRKYYYYLSILIILVELYRYVYSSSSFWTVQLIIFLVAINLGFILE